jgi:peptidoglycan/LPS O-acetylase OafA/YrhL
MAIFIAHPMFQTFLGGIVLGAILLFSIRKKHSVETLPLQTTQELKGFAILAILLGHIGYSLFPAQGFLFPLSVFSGMGVDLFLFLSGFGVTISQIKNPLSYKDFYTKRLSKLFLSLWCVLLLFFLLDFFVLHKSYSLSEWVLSFLGIFPRADLFQNINSPLWYITFILFYYLLFPIFFNKKNPALSALGFFLVAWVVLKQAIPVDSAVKTLYQLHLFAFPLGVIFAGYWPQISRFFQIKKKYIASLIVILFTVGLWYFGIHSGVGKGIFFEQGISLLLVFFTLSIFILKRFEFRFLSLLGIYSYEIYLLHWPLLSRYDLLYPYLPVSIATLVYIGVFILLGVGFKALLNIFYKKKILMK